MGLGRLFTRSTVYNVSDTVTGAVATYTVIDNLAPDFANTGSYRRGMDIPGGWRAAVMLSDLLGQVPWNAFRQRAGVPDEQIEPRPPLLEQPMPPDTRMTSFSSMALDLIWHGNAFGIIAARNAFGWPTAVTLVPAVYVGVRRVTPFVDSPLPVGALEYAVGSMRLGAEDVIHIKGPCEPGAVKGMGVLEAHLNTLNLAAEQGRQARSISTHGVPTGVLQSDDPDLEENEALEMKASWLRAQATRSIAVLNANTKFTPLSWNPEELELVESRKFTLTELELIFGLPVGWLGGQTSSRTYANIEQDGINLLKFSLGGHLARFEQTLSLAFPRGTVARANVDAILRTDTLSRYQAHALALGGKPWKTVDEVRGIEHLQPVDGGDVLEQPDAGTAAPGAGRPPLRSVG
jgi:HK97 family phage portal protein